MQDLNDLYYFAKVVEAGGFAAAGRLLGIPKSRLSRRVAELEERLGARLLQRTTRQLKLTAVGERYLRHCQAMLLEAEMADEAVASMSSEPRGRLRVSCPVGLAHEFMPGVISSFLQAYPLVQLEVSLLNRRVDLVTEGIDVALRVREEGDEDPLLVTRRLRQARTVMVASPGFARQWPVNTPEDLKMCRCWVPLNLIAWFICACSTNRARPATWYWKRAWALTILSCAKPAPWPVWALPYCP